MPINVRSFCRQAPNLIEYPKIVTYRALIGLKLEYSSLQFDPTLSRAELMSILLKPTWSLDPWPPTLTNSPADLELLAYARLKTNFDFGAQLPNGTEAEILAALYGRFQNINPEADPTTYSRFTIEADISPNGDVSWGFEWSGDLILAPGLEADPPKPYTLDGLGLFLHNLLRADARKHIDAIRQSAGH
jgi:hypothetical protein